MSTTGSPLHASPAAPKLGASDLTVLLGVAPIAMLAVDDGERILEANAYALDLFGYAREELVGSSLGRLSAPRRPANQPHPWLSRQDGALLSRSSEDDLRLKGLRRDGSDFPIELGLARVQLAGRSVRLLSLVDLSARKQVESRLMNLSIELAQRSTDLESRSAELQAQIEQRARAEADLERSREDFRFLFQRCPLPMYVYSPQTLRFLEVNEAACALYGYSRGELLAMQVTEIHPADKVRRMREALEQGKLEPFVRLRDWKHRNKDGRTIEVDTYSRALGATAESARLVAVVDVTERNAAEAQLRQAQKMEAIGQITGGVAHDFNNLLTIILGNLELIAEHCQDDAMVRSMTDDALASTRRGASLTQRLLAFSRQQPLEPRSVQPELLMVEMAGLFRRSLGEAIQVREYLAPDLWQLCVDPPQLENALLNLALNARDAMPNGGNLTLEAENAVLDEDYVREHRDVTPGEYVLLSVSDSGTGIAPETLEHIFEPFFTTKPVGKGTGLGLSMVYGLIKQSGGHLKMYSELGRGTTVKLYLPRARDGGAPPARSPREGAMPATARGEVILLVEDNDTIRKLTARLLSMQGYRVLTAADGPSALDVLGSAGDIDLLFSDIVLPNGMSGALLAEEALRRRPGLKVLFMSGYTRNALANSGDDSTLHLLSKPFRKEELARAVHRALYSLRPEDLPGLKT